MNIENSEDLLSDDVRDSIKENGMSAIESIENTTIALKPGEKTEFTYLTLTKTLPNANLDDLLTYNNSAEILKITNSAGRRCYSTWTKPDGTRYLLSDISNEERGGPSITEPTDTKNKNKDKYVLTIPGDLEPKSLATIYSIENTSSSEPYGEPDSTKAAEVQIIQPFGSIKPQKIIIWTSIAIGAISILGIGIYLIKKKALK